jgi:hypothetical protein
MIIYRCDRCKRTGEGQMKVVKLVAQAGTNSSHDVGSTEQPMLCESCIGGLIETFKRFLANP